MDPTRFYRLILRDPSATVAVINYIRCERTGGGEEKKTVLLVVRASACNQERYKAIWDPVSDVYTSRPTRSGDISSHESFDTG